QGNGSADTPGIHSRFAVPIMATAWTDQQGCMSNATFDVGEILMTQLILNAELTTAGATARIAHLNGDNRPDPTNTNLSRSYFRGGVTGPINLPSTLLSPEPYGGGSNLMGSVGLVFPGSGPLNDLGFIALVPFAQPTVVMPTQSCSCTITPGCPE